MQLVIGICVMHNTNTNLIISAPTNLTKETQP